METNTETYVVPVRTALSTAIQMYQQHNLTFQRIFTAGETDPQFVATELQVGNLIRIRTDHSNMDTTNEEDDESGESDHIFTTFVWNIVARVNNIFYLQINPIYAPAEIIPLLNEAYDDSANISGVEYNATISILPGAINFAPVDQLSPEYLSADARTHVQFLPAPVQSIDLVYKEILDIVQRTGVTAKQPTAATAVPTPIITRTAPQTATLLPTALAPPPQQIAPAAGRSTGTMAGAAPVQLPPIATPALVTPTMMGAAPPEVDQLLQTAEYQQMIQGLQQRRGFSYEGALLEARARAFADVQRMRQQQQLPPLLSLPAVAPQPPPKTTAPRTTTAPIPTGITTPTPVFLRSIEDRQSIIYNQLNSKYKTTDEFISVAPLRKSHYVDFQLDPKRSVIINAIELASGGLVDAKNQVVYLANQENQRIAYPITLDQLNAIRDIWAKEAQRQNRASTELPPFTFNIFPAGVTVTAVNIPGYPPKQQQQPYISKTKKRPVSEITPSSASSLLQQKPSTMVVSNAPPAKRRKRREPPTNITAKAVFRRERRPQFLQVFNKNRQPGQRFNIGQFNRELQVWLDQQWNALSTEEQKRFEQIAQEESRQLKAAAALKAATTTQLTTTSAPIMASTSPATSDAARSAAINQDIQNILSAIVPQNQ